MLSIEERLEKMRASGSGMSETFMEALAHVTLAADLVGWNVTAQDDGGGNVIAFGIKKPTDITDAEVDAPDAE